MSVELGRRLLASGAVGAQDLEAALLRHLSAGMPLVRALLELGHLSERALEDELARAVMPVLSTVVVLPAIVDDLPEDLCRRLLAIPVRRDPRTGTVDVAVVDPYDTHVAEEFAYHLKSEVRRVRSSLLAIDQALDHPSLRPSMRPGFASGPPIPLVRRASRDKGIEALGAHDIIDEDHESATIGSRDELAWRPRALSQDLAPLASFPATVPPSTTRGPFSPRAPVAPFPDIEGVLRAMQSASSRDQIIDYLILGMSTVARRVGVFAVKKGGCRGVACNADLGDPSSFRAIEMASDVPTIIGIAVTTGSYLGALPKTAPHEPLLHFMKEASEEVTAFLVRVAGRPAVVLFADELGDAMIATRRAEELTRAAGQAFSRLVSDFKATRRGHA